jgi:hypothetical protein
MIRSHREESAMGFVDEVARGAHGVRLVLPPAFEQTDTSETSALLVDQDRGVALQLSRSEYRLDLSPAHEALLRQDIERHARDLFIQFPALRSRPDPAPDHPLRTDDPAWSPVVEVSPRTVAGAPALEVIHRMSYEPGSEIVLGHLLFPVGSGLFELRVIGTERMATGMRETLVVEKVLASLDPSDDRDPGEQLRGRVSQRDFDDPALDASFPQHPLSMVRGALRWLREESGLVVTEPAPAVTAGELELTRLGAAFIAPPRYLLHEESDNRAQLARVSFATTDGLALLTVLSLREMRLSGTVTELLGVGEEVGREAVPSGSTDIAVTSKKAPAPDGRAGAEVHVRFTRDDALPGHTALRAFVDEWGESWLLLLGTSQSVPSDELFPQLEEVSRSFRRLGEPGRAPGSRRSWWKVW